MGHGRLEGTVACQGTLEHAAVVHGVGLFGARPVTATLKPAPAGHGVQFFRADVPGAPAIPASATAVVASPRRTTVADAKGVTVETVEHVLSALAGMGIDNALVEVDGPEMPIGDGSALLFAQAIQQAGRRLQEAPRRWITSGAALEVSDGAASIRYSPTPCDDGLELTYVLDYSGGGGDLTDQLPPQTFTWRLDRATYLREVAPARTFSTRREAASLLASGKFSHLSPRDFLVVGADGPVDNQYRFPDECARHKLLDLLGDLTLCGGVPSGKVVAVRSGHALNHKMAALLAERSAAATNNSSQLQLQP